LDLHIRKTPRSVFQDGWMRIIWSHGSWLCKLSEKRAQFLKNKETHNVNPQSNHSRSNPKKLDMDPLKESPLPPFHHVSVIQLTLTLVYARIYSTQYTTQTRAWHSLQNWIHTISKQPMHSIQYPWRDRHWFPSLHS
jgi:hypothetical protein